MTTQTTLIAAPGLPPRVAPREREYGPQFSPSGAQTRVNVSTFQLYKACPRKYYLAVLAGHAKDPDDPHLRFGILIHEAKALYELNRARGASHDLAVQGAFRWLLAETWDHRLGKPGFMSDPVKNRQTVLRTFVTYVDQYGRDQSDPCETLILPSGAPAVELRFEFDSGVRAGDGTPVTFIGTIDRLVKFNGKVYVSDIKTSTSYRWLSAANYSPDGQFSLYPLAAWVAFSVPVEGVILDGIELTASGAKFHREVVPRTLGVLDEWLADQRVHLRRLGESFDRGEWPQNDAACLSGNTVVTIQRGTRKGWKITIKDLYIMLNNPNPHNQFNPKLPTLLLVGKGKKVGFHRMLGIIAKGTKKTYSLVASNGNKIRATSDHEFLTTEGWKKVEDLRIGEELFWWDHTERSREVQASRVEIGGLYYYPKGRTRPRKGLGIRNKKLGATQRKSILVAEATLNGMTFDEFVSVLRTDEVRSKQLLFIESGYDVHHMDGNPQNDAPDNLEILSEAEHKRIHGDNSKDLSLTVLLEKVFFGEEEVFDISMDHPYHNFVANGFVVHNCGLYGGCAFRAVCATDPADRATKLALAKPQEE